MKAKNPNLILKICACKILYRSAENGCLEQEKAKQKGKPFFDEETGNWVVYLTMTPDQYARFAQDQVIADIDRVTFEKESGEFLVPVYLTGHEYGKYTLDKSLPHRYMYVSIIMITYLCIHVCDVYHDYR